MIIHLTEDEHREVSRLVAAERSRVMAWRKRLNASSLPKAALVAKAAKRFDLIDNCANQLKEAANG